jgi:hypothetical protein
MPALECFLKGYFTEIVSNVRIRTFYCLLCRTVDLVIFIGCLWRFESNKCLNNFFVTIQGSIMQGCVSTLIFDIRVYSCCTVLPFLFKEQIDNLDMAIGTCHV